MGSKEEVGKDGYADHFANRAGWPRMCREQGQFGDESGRPGQGCQLHDPQVIVSTLHSSS